MKPSYHQDQRSPAKTELVHKSGQHKKKYQAI